MKVLGAENPKLSRFLALNPVEIKRSEYGFVVLRQLQKKKIQKKSTFLIPAFFLFFFSLVSFSFVFAEWYSDQS